MTDRGLRGHWRRIALYLFLLVVAIPWYWPEDTTGLWLGLPVWVAVALLVSIVVSIITAIILLRYPWPGETDDSRE